ncbi:uncharacterized protein LOC118646617 [Monomorium pharaonis]|uniref:uncharacterized protein LOC118646617 n=1 Tax=Monomorium pharaonis TaxID=307658 RepID=UPI00174744E4|nr:uncharacterized protein LOC118646617 [Monomorium pharaonis]
MKPIAKGLDILQEDKHIFMGYLLPILLSIKEHLNKKLTEVFYAKPLANTLLKGIHKRFYNLYKYNDLRIVACLIPDFKHHWIQNTKSFLIKLLKSIVQKFNFNDAEVHTSTLKEQKVFRKPDNFFILPNTLDQNQNKNMITDHIVQIYLSTDTFATKKDFPKALKRAFIKYNTSIPSSAHVERLFSARGLIFDNLRNLINV